jgi:outer membrane protein W
MITIFRRAAALALALTATAFGSASAQVQVEVSTFVGGTWFLTDPPNRFAIPSAKDAQPLFVEDGSYRDYVTAGFTAGLRFADNYAVEGFFAWMPTRLTASSGLEAQGGDMDANSFMYGGNLLYHFTQFSPTVQPFIGLGVGGETMSYEPQGWERHTTLQGNALVGTNVWLTDGIALRFDARDCLSSWESHLDGVDDTTENDLMLSVGLSFRTGPIGR